MKAHYIQVLFKHSSLLIIHVLHGFVLVITVSFSSRSTLFLNALLYRFSVEFGLKYKMQYLHSSRHAIKEKDSLLLPFNFGNIWLSISLCPAEPLIFFKHCRSRSAGF